MSKFSDKPWLVDIRVGIGKFDRTKVMTNLPEDIKKIQGDERRLKCLAFYGWFANDIASLKRNVEKTAPVLLQNCGRAVDNRSDVLLPYRDTTGGEWFLFYPYEGEVDEKFLRLLHGTMYDSPHSWQNDYDRVDGNYHHECRHCGTPFAGHRQRVKCKVCYLEEVENRKCF